MLLNKDYGKNVTNLSNETILTLMDSFYPHSNPSLEAKHENVARKLK